MTAPTSDAALFDILRLARADGVGPRTFQQLLARHGSATRAIEAVSDVTRRARGRPIVLAEPEAIARELETALQLGIRYIALGDPLYPPRLAAIEDAPVILGVRGRIEALAREAVAIVGARNASAAGLAMAERLARGLGAAGYTIVSGLARGIDGRAHRASLMTGTVAVLAGGLDKPYPPDHADLFDRIVEHGAAVSEMPVGWHARGRDFPRRNRIVSGLAAGTIIVEAARRSGSLITARFAADQGRDVFAVPGSPLDPRAEGPNDLLRDGATFCTSVEDVLTAFAEPRRPSALKPMPTGEADLFASPLSIVRESVVDDPPSPVLHVDPIAAAPSSGAPPASDAARIYAMLGPTPVSIDVLVRAADMPARHVRSILMELELDGRLARHGGDLVSRT